MYIYVHNTQLYTYTRHCTCIYTSVYIAFFEVEGPCLMLWRMDLASAHRIAQCPLNAIYISLSLYTYIYNQQKCGFSHQKWSAEAIRNEDLTMT